jgi:hypothetical protein
MQIRVREIDQAWIYGIYQCTARNSLGQLNIDINVFRASTYAVIVVIIVSVTENDIC